MFLHFSFILLLLLSWAARRVMRLWRYRHVELFFPAPCLNGAVLRSQLQPHAETSQKVDSLAASCVIMHPLLSLMLAHPLRRFRCLFQSPNNNFSFQLLLTTYPTDACLGQSMDPIFFIALLFFLFSFEPSKFFTWQVCINPFLLIHSQGWGTMHPGIYCPWQGHTRYSSIWVSRLH